jgi:hypothetical protein
MRLATQDGRFIVDKRIKSFPTELLYELWKCEVIHTTDVPGKGGRPLSCRNGTEKSHDTYQVFHFVKKSCSLM